MPLTTAEIGFLEVYAYEYMRLENGPASRKLKDKGFIYSDVIDLLDAYNRAHPPLWRSFETRQANLSKN